MSPVLDADEGCEPGHRAPPDAVLPPAPPLLPDRGPGRVAVRQVAPLAAGPSEEEDRIDHLAPIEARWRTPAALWIEEIPNKRPVLISQLDQRAHGPERAPRPRQVLWHEGSSLIGNFHSQALRVDPVHGVSGQPESTG